MKISIPEPCHEDWNKMTPVDFQRRHCAACDRTLTDFTAMTDAEVGRHLRRSSGKLCGRFKVSQLDRKLMRKAPRSFGGLRAAAAAAGLLLTVPATAQEVVPLKTEWNLRVERLAEEIELVKDDQLDATADTVIVRGTITDPSGETLIGASILIKGTTIGTTTDIDGKFSLPIATDSSVVFLVRYTGFTNTEHRISVRELTKTAKLNTSLELDAIICEESATGYITTNRYLSLRDLVAPVSRYVVWPVKKTVRNISDWRRGRFDRRDARQLRRAERRAALAETPTEAPIRLITPEKVEQSSPVVAPGDIGFSASPNPFTDHLRVNFSLEERGSYRLELYAASGKLVGNWEGIGEAGPQERVVDQQLGNLPKGMYFLELRTKEVASVLTMVR